MQRGNASGISGLLEDPFSLCAASLLMAAISLCLIGCSETLIPTLPPASTHTPVAQLAQEGKLDPDGIWSDDNQAIEFSVPAEQLAALVIQAAKTEGWHARDTVNKYKPHPLSPPEGRKGDTYFVHLLNPFEEHWFGYAQHDIMIYTTQGRSAVQVSDGGPIGGDDESALPRTLLDPVREHVQAYLAGRPLTVREKRQLREAALAHPERLPEERLNDIKRLRDQGYLNAEEYERKRAEILKSL